MIKANELKIGNWVNYLGTPTQLLTGKQIDDNHKVVNPILITPEILEKAGFENKMLNNFWFLGNGDLVIEGFKHDYNGIYIGKIEYLHQLQNIYFWLTGGEELTVNFKDLTYQ